LRLTTQRLMAESEATGFRLELLEKAVRLLGVLEGIQSHPLLKNRLALKGGTALNLFVFDLPRLSVDVDLNYVGATDREVMLTERPRIEKALQIVCAREELTVSRSPTEHAGGKWRLRYASVLGGGGALEVDMNFMLRVPLWPVKLMDSRALGGIGVRQIPVLDVNELAAGKLAALLSRRASRDLFDAHLLLTSGRLDPERLRLGFVLYGAMNRRDWREVRTNDVDFEAKELKDQLIPTVRSSLFKTLPDRNRWARELVAQCRTALASLLPLRESERAFLDQLLDRGQISPSLLTDDAHMAERIASHPMLQWKAANIREHRKLP
jgi:predicted nucleotidyltransferase component of viral defense system